MTLLDGRVPETDLLGASAALAAAVGRPELATREGLEKWAENAARALEVAAAAAPRLHRRHRLPPAVMARMLTRVEADEQPYAAHLLPPLLVSLTRQEIEAPDVGPLIQPVIEGWAQRLRDLGDHSGGVAAEVLPAEGWERVLDPDDWVSGADEGSGAVVSEESPLVDSPEWSAWDASTRRALASLPARMATEERLALLVGVWSGAAHSIRTPKAWDAAMAWIDAADGRRVRAIADLAAARAWTLATDGPMVSVPDEDRAAIERFLSWAYARAATWPTFSSPDADILRRLRAVGESDDGEGEVATEGVISAIDRRWPRWVRTAVESRRVAPERPERFVQREEATTPEEVLARLDRLEGLDEVKKLFRTLLAQVGHAKTRRAQGHDEPLPDLHLVLTGNPGTGKTTVARLYGQFLRAIGMLESGRFVECVRSDLVSRYQGGPSDKARAAVESADGGLLFIDEAYSLTQGNHGEGDGTGQEIVTELVAQMEARRGRFAVVLAGYPGPMQNFIASNPGLESRIRAPILLPDLSSAALTRVLDGMAEDLGYVMESSARDALTARIATLPRGERFGNAREIRRLLDVVRGNVARRFHEAPTAVDPNVITLADVPTSEPGRRDDEGFAVAIERIDRLVGLEPVKQEIKQIAAQVAFTEQRRAAGEEVARTVVGHLVFTGNPGTGKTTVAAEVGAILASLGVLASGHVHTVTHADLIAQYLGQTAPKVRAQVQQALDGVLFIDEAYSLLPRTAGNHHNYEEIALTTLVDEMERNRDRLVVILAGYPKEMQALLDANQGLRSRISRTIEFPDYDRSELREIAAVMVASSGLAATDAALDAMADTASAEAGRVGFGNARTIRELLTDAERRHAVRVTEPGAPSDVVPGLIDVMDVRAPAAPHKLRLGFT